MNLPIDTQAIERFGLCVFNKPVVIDGATYTGARRVVEATVRDRIEAERWCRDEFGFVSSDGILAGIASKVIEFGNVEGKYELDKNGKIIGPLNLVNGKSLPPDQIVSHFSYDDFTLVAIVLGKTTPSSESETQSSENSLNASPTEKSE
ncbi:hypothetical protein [Vibrio sp. OPT18]|uniref:hypothetical protein n=1 Tax=Vibrio sp. OPT18 TaxID=2778641 RepID=UPI0018808297|nr:hypothetical protein [Vibrio sp. OPT18]MBE8578726.1 hypothetical protein [Vibrio sp. OPT18]